MNENTTNFFDVLERPLTFEIPTPQPRIVFTEASALSPQPSALSDLWSWSLQFDVPIWLIALLALGLAVVVAWEVLSVLNRLRDRVEINTNRRRAAANSILQHIR